MKLFWFFSLLFLTCISEAASGKRGGFDSTKIGLTQQIYTGPSKSSFADGSPAYGLELSVDSGTEYFRYFFKTRFNTSSGSQNFLKNTTTYFTKYDYMSFEAELGGAFYPIARQDKGLNIYLWGVGSISYNYLVLKNVPSTVNVDSKSQEFGTGYGGGLGFEYVIGRGKGRSVGRYSIYSELGFRNTYASLAEQKDFQVSGMTIALGVGF